MEPRLLPTLLTNERTIGNQLHQVTILILTMLTITINLPVQEGVYSVTPLLLYVIPSIASPRLRWTLALWGSMGTISDEGPKDDLIQHVHGYIGWHGF